MFDSDEECTVKRLYCFFFASLFFFKVASSKNLKKILSRLSCLSFLTVNRGNSLPELQ